MGFNEVSFDERGVTGEKRPYWYFTYVHFCPPCGGEERWRERRYGLKPNDPGKRQSWEQHLCYQCSYSMFM